DREPAEILASWAAQKTWTVLGVESILLLALRRGCEQGNPAVQGFLETHFAPDYQALIRSKPLGQVLDQIRTQRNDIVHRGVIFDAAGYEVCIPQVFGHRRFRLWEDEGPVPAPPGPGSAILHHHILYSRVAAASASPPDRVRSEGSKPPPDDPAVR